MRKILPLLFFATFSNICFGLNAYDSGRITENTAAVITASESSLSGFHYFLGAGPSAQQSFSISGSNLTNGINVKAPTNYEISAYGGSAFVGTSSMTIAPTGGTVTTLTLYVRLKAGLAVNAYNGDITLISTGATSKTISLSGYVPPVIITPSVTSLSGFAYTKGEAYSPEMSFTVSGSNLTSGIVITAPREFEISTLTGTSFSGARSITLGQNNGEVEETAVYVRMKSGLAAGTYGGDITLASTGGTTKTITLDGNVNLPAGITASATSLVDFAYYIGAGPSAIQSFEVSGNSLTSYVIVTGPENFEISTDAGEEFTGTGQIVLVPIDGTIPATHIYVRMEGGLVVNNYNGTISITSTGYPGKNVSLAGMVKLTTLNPGFTAKTISAYATDSEIIVLGTEKGKMVSLYSLSGVRIQSVVSEDGRAVLKASRGAVYLVKTATKTVKIVL